MVIYDYGDYYNSALSHFTAVDTGTHTAYYVQNYEAASLVTTQDEKEDDGFWHPPYLWVEADWRELLPLPPVIDWRWEFKALWPRAPPEAVRVN